MPRLAFTNEAITDLSRLRQFLAGKSPAAARRAIETIRERLQALPNTPEIGRPLRNKPEYRELVIPFGDGGYIARYRYSEARQTVYVVAIWHQKEAGN